MIKPGCEKSVTAPAVTSANTPDHESVKLMVDPELMVDPAGPIALPALTDRQYRFLIHTVGAGLGALRRDGLTVSDEREQAIRWLLDLVRQSAGHQTVTKVDSGSADGRVSACTTAEAGQRLGLTRWAVRKAIARGALTARQATARGPYVIDEQSIAAFERRKRAARAA